MNDFSTARLRGEGSLVFGINVFLLIALAALSVLAMGKSASAHFNSYDSVRCPASGCAIRYANSSDYVLEVSHAVSTWNNLNAVSILPDNENTALDVRFVNAPNQCDVSWVGQYSYSSSGLDYIRFNVCNFNQSNYDVYDKKGTAAHEMGHALGLAHSYSPNLMYSPSRSTGNNTPQSHDIADYRDRWGY
jgi:hypothetical protein